MLQVDRLTRGSTGQGAESAIYDWFVVQAEELEEERVKEEDRLIATIAEIDEQTSLVPRGAFVLEPTGHVTINRCFEGTLTDRQHGQNIIKHHHHHHHHHHDMHPPVGDGSSTVAQIAADLRPSADGSTVRTSLVVGGG